MTQIYVVQFVNFVIFIVLHLESLPYTVLVHVISTLQIFFEFREMYLSGYSYFSSVWNWLDWFGNISIMIHCFFFEIYGDESLKKGSTKLNLIFGLFTYGSRAVSALRIYK